MADLKLECSNCGALFQVSEYVESPLVNCPQCDQELEVAKATVVEESGLKVRRDKSGSGLGGSEDESDRPVVAAPPPMSRKQQREMERNRKKEEQRKKDGKDPYQKTAPKPWHGWVALVVLTAVLVGLQHIGGGENPWYYNIRLVLFPLIYIAVIVAAFGEGYLAGILCLLLPPYLFYYAISRTDVYYIRGAFVAMMISLCMEQRYNSERSFLTHVQTGINAVIDGGAGAINRAGSSGVEFVE